MARQLSSSYRGMSPEEILEKYPEVFRDCRVSHQWPRRAIFMVLSPRVRERTVQCRNCGLTKSFLIDDSGQRISPTRSSYPRGYLTPKSGLARADFAARAYNADFERALNEGRVRVRGDAATNGGAEKASPPHSAG